MATIKDVCDRLELDAKKFVDSLVGAEGRYRDIVESAFLLGELHVANKVIKYFEENDKKESNE